MVRTHAGHVLIYRNGFNCNNNNNNNSVLLYFSHSTALTMVNTPSYTLLFYFPVSPSQPLLLLNTFNHPTPSSWSDFYYHRLSRICLPCGSSSLFAVSHQNLKKLLSVRSEDSPTEMPSMLPNYFLMSLHYWTIISPT